MKNIVKNVLVIKIGTSTLIHKNTDGSEQLDFVSFSRIARQVIALQASGLHIVLVSSAAITAGMVATGLTTRPNTIDAMPNLQRLASIGWRHVLNAWGAAFDGVAIGGLLLTHHELSLGSEREELLRVTYQLMIHGDIAIVNENDAITHSEIAFGDNDTLAATFAARIAKSTLFGGDVRFVILSDIDGVYGDIQDCSSVIGTIDSIGACEHLAQATMGQNGTGGMTTKFAAAKIAHRHGVQTYIANGRQEDAISRALNGEIGTRFTL